MTENSSLESILEDVKLSQLLRQFMKDTHSDENLMFYEAVLELKQQSNPDDIEKKINDIYEAFIREGSPQQVNLDYEETKIIKDELKKDKRNPTIYDDAFDEIKFLIENDVLRSFQWWLKQQQEANTKVEDSEQDEKVYLESIDSDEDLDIDFTMENGFDADQNGDLTTSKETIMKIVPKFFQEAKTMLFYKPTPLVLYIIDTFMRYVHILALAKHGLYSFTGVFLATIICNITFSFVSGMLHYMYQQCKEATSFVNTRRSSISFLRTAMMLVIISIPTIILWCFFGSIFSFDKDLAQHAGFYGRLMIIALPFTLAKRLVRTYLKSQGVIILEASIVALAFHAGLAFLFILPLKMGVLGAVLAFIIGELIHIVGMIVVSKFIRHDKIIFFDFTKEELFLVSELKEVFIQESKQGINYALNSFGFELPFLLTASMGPVYIAGYAILFFTFKTSYASTYGICKCVKKVITERIHNLRIEDAVFFSKSSLILNFILSMITLAFVMIIRKVLSYSVISDVNVNAVVRNTVPITLLALLAEGFVMPIVEYLPRSVIIQAIIIGRYYLVSLPLCIGLSFKFSANMDVIGLWLSLCCAFATSLIALLVILFRTNWGRKLFEEKIGVEYEKKTLIELDEMYW